MEIVVAKRAGFCFGVKRAIDIAFKVARDKPHSAATLGPIIHNPQVIKQLRKNGIRTVDTITGNHSIIIIRTHGIEFGQYEALKQSGHTVIDATCPFVKKAQQYAKLLAEEGYQVLILGDAEHPEVKGIKSYAGDDAIVISDSDSLPKMKQKVGIVVQTTQPVESLKRLINKTIGRAKELKIFNTICNSTALRLKETKAMAKKVDLMVVVGGKNSANTTQLFKLCASLGIPTYHIETAKEIRKKWLHGINKVGITAGASTPEWIIDEVTEKLSAIGG